MRPYLTTKCSTQGNCSPWIPSSRALLPNHEPADLASVWGAPSHPNYITWRLLPPTATARASSHHQLEQSRCSHRLGLTTRRTRQGHLKALPSPFDHTSHIALTSHAIPRALAYQTDPGRSGTTRVQDTSCDPASLSVTGSDQIRLIT